MMTSSGPNVRSASSIAWTDRGRRPDRARRTRLAQLRQAGVQPLMSRPPARIVVRRKVLERRRLRRRDDENVRAVARALLHDHPVQRFAGDCLVRDHEDPALVVGMRSVGPTRGGGGSSRPRMKTK